MSEQTLEINTAKLLEQEKLEIIAPMIHKLALRKEEVAALLTLSKVTLKHLNTKVADVLGTRKHSTVIRDPRVPAKLLWAVAKSATVAGEKIEANRVYTARLTGTQILACYSVATTLYNVDRDAKPDSLQLTSNKEKC